MFSTVVPWRCRIVFWHLWWGNYCFQSNTSVFRTKCPVVTYIFVLFSCLSHNDTFSISNFPRKRCSSLFRSFIYFLSMRFYCSSLSGDMSTRCGISLITWFCLSIKFVASWLWLFWTKSDRCISSFSLGRVQLVPLLQLETHSIVGGPVILEDLGTLWSLRHLESLLTQLIHLNKLLIWRSGYERVIRGNRGDRSTYNISEGNRSRTDRGNRGFCRGCMGNSIGCRCMGNSSCNSCSSRAAGT